ncbi:MAG: Hint domain-containing protein [Rhodobacteraceae bacterium]|nr:Hint domain-containing protein [Paracoccaceae bacterium]
MHFTFFEVNGDPLNGGPLRVGSSGQATVEDDDDFLQPNTEDSGAQFSIDGVDFTSSAYPTDTSTGSNVEIYSATVRIGGVNQTVTFAYLTAANDGVDDSVDRIVQLSGPTLSEGMRLRNINLDSGNTNVEYSDVPSLVPCFTPGTMITTPRGQIPVELLRVGDLVITADNGLQAIRWIGRKRMSGARLQAYPKLRPIRIRKNAFGDGLPDRDMWVSPQHRMLISSERTLLDHGEREVLAPAKGLLNDHSITVDYGVRETEYIHILFDRHEIVFANGAPSESFHPGMMAMSALDEGSRDELFDIFPELEDEPKSYGPSARFSLRVQETKSL